MTAIDTAHDVGALQDFPDRKISSVTVGTRRVGLVRVGDDVFAFAERCPHMGGPLTLGHLETRLHGTGYGELSSEGPVLTCPWHGWQYDMSTGQALDAPEARMLCFGARVEGGRVLIEPGRRAASERET
jgi:nitrite reductase/ring-hydroxylating ferredoxin subunit